MLVALLLGLTIVGCGARVLSAGTARHAAPAAGPSARAALLTAVVPTGDWTRFDDDAQRSGVGPANTGIDASQSALPSDAGRSHLRGSRLLRGRVARREGHGRVRDVILITTSYGETIAIDPATGRTLWKYVPGDIRAYLGSAQITTATPIIDPDRGYVYAASPGWDGSTSSPSPPAPRTGPVIGRSG